MKPTDPGWRELAVAFYALAHNDERRFHALDAWLKDTEVGLLCQEYILTGDHERIEEAGYLLTGTKQWYVYLGRGM